MPTITFQPARKTEAKLRLALIGPAGSGKTYTALRIATAMGGKIALMDTEHGSAAKYADLFRFDTFAPDSFEPEVYVSAINAAAQAGYDILIIDGLSQAWAGKGGLLEYVDLEAARGRGNAFTDGWRKATPRHNALVDAILAAPLHIIATLRTKMAYVLEPDERGKMVPRKVGLQPVQREGLEYEFDVVGDLTPDNTLIISKTRCPALQGKIFPKPGEDVAKILLEWLRGEPAPAQPSFTPITPPAHPTTSAPSTSTRPLTQKSARPLSAEEVRAVIQTKVARASAAAQRPASENQISLLAAKLEEAFGDVPNPEMMRHDVLEWLFGVRSARDLTAAQASAVLDWLLDKNASPGTYDLHPAAYTEAAACYRAAIEAKGQLVMEIKEDE